MKCDFQTYDFQMRAKAYWKNRKPTLAEYRAMMAKMDEKFIIIHHPNGLTERIPRK